MFSEEELLDDIGVVLVELDVLVVGASNSELAVDYAPAVVFRSLSSEPRTQRL